MAERMNTGAEIPPVPGAGPTQPVTPRSRSSATTKVVIAVVALGVVAVIAGVAVAAVTFYLRATDAVTEVAGEIEGALTTPEDVVEEGLTQAAQAAPPVPNSEVFTFRNVFVPLVQASSTTTATTADASGSSTETATAAPANTLYAQGVVTEGAVTKVILKYGSSTYTLGPGETVPGTGWKVVSVSSTSVGMQYNGVNYTLSIGQGLTK